MNGKWPGWDAGNLAQHVVDIQFHRRRRSGHAGQRGQWLTDVTWCQREVAAVLDATEVDISPQHAGSGVAVTQPEGAIAIGQILGEGRLQP